jgi:hypothetical protein
VAIKILPVHLSENPEARQRFDREARAISSLKLPGFAAMRSSTRIAMLQPLAAHFAVPSP